MATKKEIVDKLVELGIEHDESASKAELEALLPEGSIPEEVEEDAPHKAYRQMIEDYKKQNPKKYEQKKEAFERKLKAKLAFVVTPEGKPLDGSIDPASGKRIPLEIIEVK